MTNNSTPDVYARTHAEFQGQRLRRTYSEGPLVELKHELYARTYNDGQGPQVELQSEF